jgi:predicted metal-dependent hydrolase
MHYICQLKNVNTSAALTREMSLFSFPQQTLNPCNATEMTPPEYTAIRKRGRKSVSIIVRPDQTVQIIVPHGMAEKAIKHIVATKQNWINKKLDELKNSDFQRTDQLYQEGELFLFMGRHLSLVITTGRGSVRISNDNLHVTVPPGLQGEDRTHYIRHKLLEYYHAEALKLFREKTSKIGETLGITPVYVAVKDYKSRWGTCFSDGRIYYNWRLILTPESIIEYVIAHELCHLKVPNHSKRFWQLVETVIPDWKIRRKWLRINSHALWI